MCIFIKLLLLGISFVSVYCLTTSDPTPPERKSCQSRNDCKDLSSGPWLCKYGKCRPKCTGSSGMCLPDESCTDEFCLPTCTSDEQCVAPESREAYFCSELNMCKIYNFDNMHLRFDKLYKKTKDMVEKEFVKYPGDENGTDFYHQKAFRTIWMNQAENFYSFIKEKKVDPFFKFMHECDGLMEVFENLKAEFDSPSFKQHLRISENYTLVDGHSTMNDSGKAYLQSVYVQTMVPLKLLAMFYGTCEAMNYRPVNDETTSFLVERAAASVPDIIEYLLYYNYYKEYMIKTAPPQNPSPTPGT